jgi:hypothetical protein
LPVVWLPELGRIRIGASAILEVHAIPADEQGRPEARRLTALRDALASTSSATGIGLAATDGGQLSAWTPLQRDSVGAVLDPDDLASRLTTMLSVLAGFAATGSAEVGFATGITTSITLAEGRVSDLPRQTTRSRTSMSPVRVPAMDVLPSHRIAVNARGIGEELAARILLDFR